VRERLRRLLARREVPGRYEWAWLAAVFAVSFLLVLSRRPDALLNAQFFLEDGIWYEQAHEMGVLESLAYPYFRGYLHLVPRLAAAVALAAPFAWAPFVMSAIGTAIETLPAVFLCSNRLADAVPSLAARCGLAVLYVGLPNSWSPVDCTIANVTHAQWHLAPLVCMALVARPAGGRAWRAFDAAAVVLGGLSGPSGIFLAPVAALVWWRRRTRWSLVLFALTAATAAIQMASLLLTTDTTASRPPLGPSAPLLARLVAGRVVYGLVAGQTGYSQWFDDPASVWMRPEALAIAAVLGAAAIAYAAWRGPFELRMFALFTAIAFAAFLVWPVPSPVTVPHWELMTRPGHHRYFVAPMFALALALAWTAWRGARPLRAAAAALLAAAVLFGVRADWREPAHPDLGFPASVRKYEQAAPGERVQIAYPPNWSIVLIRR
jgi:hypothetical protein